jgi:CheY-like chemotaxis protein
VHEQGEELLCYSILANLLKNALEASPEGAQVRVSLRRQSDHNGEAVALDIHNDGEVPQEVRERFFQKYATHGKADGTGLGAYSARLMARVQRGSLQMTSGAGGTTLSLRLPVWHSAVPARPGTVAASPAASAQVLPALSVLLVDDDEYNIVVLKSLLPTPPLVVRTAVNGRAALELVRAQRPDVIFLDLEMPVMGGLEAVRQIRALERERGDPPSRVAAFSAHDDEATRAQCLAAGFDLYLAKPASREEVLAVLLGQDAAAAAPAARRDSRIWVEPGLMPLIPDFLRSRRRLAEDLATAITAGEREVIRSTAHRLAGSLAMYGFRDASHASRDLEQAAGSEDLGALRARSDALAQMLAQAEPVARPA